MDKNNPPRSFGVFKPTGYTVLALESQEVADAAFADLLLKQFDAQAMARYKPGEMLAQVQSDLHTASPFAAVGQDLNLVRAHGALAELGCHFLVVPTPYGERVDRVRDVIARGGVKAAQRYGAFIIEDLIGLPPGETQSFESPDRGLDIDVKPEPDNALKV